MFGPNKHSGPPPLPGDVSLSREMRLMLACSWIPPESRVKECSEEIRTLCDEGIDWEGFLKLVQRHRIPALAWAVLDQYAAGRIPEAVRTYLRERDKANRLQALGHTSELLRLLMLFAGADIDLLPLKGPALSIQIYGDPGLRQSKDLDLLILPEDLDRADALLRGNGYERTFPDYEPSEKQKAIISKCYQEYSYSHANSSIQLELHWKVDLWKPEDLVALRESSFRAEWHGASIRCLEETMLLLFLCDHGASHEWFRAKWLGETAWMMARCGETDWNRLADLAKRLDLERPLCQTALLARWLYRVPADGRIDAMTDRHSLRLAKRSLRALLASEKEFIQVSFLEKWRRRIYLLKLRTRPSYAHFFQKLFIDPVVLQKVQLPQGMFWLHYPLRLIFWFKRHYL